MRCEGLSISRQRVSPEPMNEVTLDAGGAIPFDRAYAMAPLRFRANIYLDGVEPWQELNWLDHEITVGSTRLGVFHRTRRCEATNVDPANGTRDMAIPSTLLRTWGHADFGVYAKVIAAGRIATGDPVDLV